MSSCEDCKVIDCAKVNPANSISIAATKQVTGMDSAISFLRRECSRNGIPCSVDYKSNADAVIIVRRIIDGVNDNKVLFPALLTATGYARPRVVVEEMTIEYTTSEGLNVKYIASDKNIDGQLVCSAASIGILQRLNNAVIQKKVPGTEGSDSVYIFPDITYAQLFNNGDIDSAMGIIAKISDAPEYVTYGRVKTCDYVLRLHAALDSCDHGYASTLLN